MKSLFLILGFCATFQLAAQQTTGHVSVSMRYWLYLPRAYDTDPSKLWPLVIFLHGSGERGADLTKVKVHGPPKLADGREFPFILLSPQCPEGERWNVYLLNKLLDDIIARYRVEPDRVYLTGLSMGGQGTWLWATANPERFAALAPVCGWGAPDQSWRIRHLPTWVFHGGKDNVVPLKASEDMINALKKEGGNPKFTLYPEAGHDSWTETYLNDSLYVWLLEQRRNPVPDFEADPGFYSRLTGTYRLSNKDTVEILTRDNTLWAKTSREEVHLKPDGVPGAFYFGAWYENRLVFRLKGNKKVRNIEIKSRNGQVDGRRERM